MLITTKIILAYLLFSSKMEKKKKKSYQKNQGYNMALRTEVNEANFWEIFKHDCEIL